MKTQSSIASLQKSSRSLLNPIKNLTPQSLSSILDQFASGNLSTAALTWDAIERRDDTIQAVSSKRKKAIAHLPWEIISLDNSPEALLHKKTLQYFYNNLSASNALDLNQSGGFPLLIKQMLDSVGKKYAVHEIIYQPSPPLPDGTPQLTANFKFVPLQFFDNSSGKLHLINPDSQIKSPLDQGNWLVTTGEGLMEASSIAYLFKHLPLRDWLVYSERNGMPGVMGITDSLPGSEQWRSALNAVQDFGSEFHALMTRGTEIKPIDLSSSSELPYPALVERMDRAIIALWRGSDLSTLSKPNATGASLQSNETLLIEKDDAALISETLNSQVDRFVLNHTFGVSHGKAYIRIQPNNSLQTNQDLQLYQSLANLGVPIPLNHIRERFGIPQISNNEPTLQSKKSN